MINVLVVTTKVTSILVVTTSTHAKTILVHYTSQHIWATLVHTLVHTLDAYLMLVEAELLAVCTKNYASNTPLLRN